MESNHYHSGNTKFRVNKAEPVFSVPTCISELPAVAANHIWPCVCDDELDIRAVCMEDGDTYPPWWMDQKLGKIRKTRVVSKAELQHIGMGYSVLIL